MKERSFDSSCFGNIVFIGMNHSLFLLQAMHICAKDVRRDWRIARSRSGLTTADIKVNLWLPVFTGNGVKAPGKTLRPQRERGEIQSDWTCFESLDGVTRNTRVTKGVRTRLKVEQDGLLLTPRPIIHICTVLIQIKHCFWPHLYLSTHKYK